MGFIFVDFTYSLDVKSNHKRRYFSQISKLPTQQILVIIKKKTHNKFGVEKASSSF